MIKSPYYPTLTEGFAVFDIQTHENKAPYTLIERRVPYNWSLTGQNRGSDTISQVLPIAEPIDSNAVATKCPVASMLDTSLILNIGIYF